MTTSATEQDPIITSINKAKTVFTCDSDAADAESTEEDTSGSIKIYDDYLTLAPSGLESFVADQIKETLSLKGYFCDISELGCSPPEKISTLTRQKHPFNREGVLDDIAARIEQSKLSKQQKKLRKRNKINNDDCEPQNHDLSRVAGSIHCEDIGSMISIGYHIPTKQNNQLQKPNTHRIAATPGTIEGVALVSFSTDASPLFVASMSGMGCGPLLALVTSSSHPTCSTNSETTSANGEILHFDQSMEQAISEIKRFTKDSNSYAEKFQLALQLWYRHANEVWFAPNSIYGLAQNDTLCSETSYSLPPKTTEKSATFPSQTKSMPIQPPFAYRMSCLRSHSKKYSYKREAMLSHLDDLLIPWKDLQRIEKSLMSINHNSNHVAITNEAREIAASDFGGSTDNFYNNNTDRKRKMDDVQKDTEQEASFNSNLPNNQEQLQQNSMWHVDLKKYDFDILTIIHSQSVTVAVPLRPYQYWGSKSYSSNMIPTDGTGGGWFGSLGARAKMIENEDKEDEGSGGSFLFPEGFLRLRPSTADILINIANPPSHSVILDPCAGIGTIPLRSGSSSHYGLGGEVSQPIFWNAAPHFVKCNQMINCNGRQISDLAGWDATILPLRDSFVDAVISDIPFGQKCMSSSELMVFMPSLFYQCARVLVPKTGKMLLLCGNFETVVKCLFALNERSRIIGNGNIDENVKSNGKGNNHDDKSCVLEVVFQLPCESIFPVNIGGHIAWIVVVKRGTRAPVPPANYRRTAKRVMVKRINGEKAKALSKQNKASKI